MISPYKLKKIVSSNPQYGHVLQTKDVIQYGYVLTFLTHPSGHFHIGVAPPGLNLLLFHEVVILIVRRWVAGLNHAKSKTRHRPKSYHEIELYRRLVGEDYHAFLKQ